MYTTKFESKSWFPSCTSLSIVPSASTEKSPFHFSNSNAAASSSLALRAFASSSYMKHHKILQQGMPRVHKHTYTHMQTENPIKKKSLTSISSFASRSSSFLLRISAYLSCLPYLESLAACSAFKPIMWNSEQQSKTIIWNSEQQSSFDPNKIWNTNFIHTKYLNILNINWISTNL